MRRSAAIPILAVAGLLTGCGWSQRIEKEVAPDTVSLADRCADIMKRAMPFAEIDVGDKTSQSMDVRTIVAHVQGSRTDMPDSSQVERDLAVECTFVDNVLTAFRWTKGGPPSPSPAP
jgi:hypothetical protein